MPVTVELGYPETATTHGPTAKQAIAHAWAAWVDETLYGGAAGGGKTDWLIAEVLRALFQWPGVDAGIFRRSFTELSQAGGIIPRLLARIPPTVGHWNGSEHVWHFRPTRPSLGGGGAHTSTGSKLYLGHVRNDTELANYLGAEYALQAWDQVEAHTEWQFVTMQSRLRVPRALAAAGLRPRAIATANPGGRGHGWLKRRFIDAAPPMVVWQPNPTDHEPRPGTRLYVPALLDDNPHLDPDYERRLDNLDPEKRRAWRYGDWDVMGGTRFAQFRRAVHVIDPSQLPVPLAGGVPKALGVDYGITAPFCALWGALFPGNPPLVVVYRELYRPELTPRQQAQMILGAEKPGERDPHGRPLPAYIDPSTWRRSEEGQKADPLHPERPPAGSIAAKYAEEGVPVRKANNDRLAGAAGVDEALTVHRYDEGVTMPGLLVYSSCPNLIRTLPELIRDEKNPEDVDTDGEDHAYDALRYLLGGLGRIPNRRRLDQPTNAADARLRAARNVTGDLARAGF